MRFACHPDAAAGFAGEPSALEPGRTQHRAEQRLVARPIRYVPLALQRDQQPTKFGWVIGFQLAFVGSMLMLAIADRLGAEANKKP